MKKTTFFVALIVWVALSCCSDDDLLPSIRQNQDSDSADTVKITFTVAKPVISIKDVIPDLIPSDTIQLPDDDKPVDPPPPPPGDPNGGGKPGGG